MLVYMKEIRIDTFQQIIEREDLKVLVEENSYQHRILVKVRINAK